MKSPKRRGPKACAKRNVEDEEDAKAVEDRRLAVERESVERNEKYENLGRDHLIY